MKKKRGRKIKTGNQRKKKKRKKEKRLEEWRKKTNKNVISKIQRKIIIMESG
jgi:hypothetical protein